METNKILDDINEVIEEYTTWHGSPDSASWYAQGSTEDTSTIGRVESTPEVEPLSWYLADYQNIILSNYHADNECNCHERG